MVLVGRLTNEEKIRHKLLIKEWAENNGKTLTEDVKFIGNGVEKGVYRVKSGEEEYVAVAANRDNIRSLLEEYNKLHHLYNGCSNYFPQPHSHYSSSKKKGELIIMEFLPHLPIDEFEKSEVPNFYRKLAYQVGKGVSIVNSNTGMFPSEPHDGNLLLGRKKDDLELKFCDASQFRSGNLEEAMRSIVWDSGGFRPESFRFIERFYSGVVDGLISQGITPDKDSIVKFLNQFNPIL